MRQSHSALQQSITSTIRQATQQAAQQMDETVQPILGDRAEQFKEAFKAHGAEPVVPDGPENPQAGSVSSRPASSQPPAPGNTARPGSGRESWEDEDEDFGNGSFLR